MNSGAAESIRLQKGENLCLIGYGETDRRDDGAGPFAVKLLEKRLGRRRHIRYLTNGFLDVGLLAEIGAVRSLILVDACLHCPAPGWGRAPIEPMAHRVPVMTHSIEPAFFLFLFEMIYGRLPEAWIVSIQGEDFGHGRGLSAGTWARTVRAVEELAEFVSKEN